MPAPDRPTSSSPEQCLGAATAGAPAAPEHTEAKLTLADGLTLTTFDQARRCPNDGQTLAWHLATEAGPDGSPRTNASFIGCDWITGRPTYTPPASNNGPDVIAAKIERSSLGTPDAQALRATVSDEHAARIVDRARELEHEALRSIWREAAQKGIESGIDWPRIVLALFKDLDAAEQLIAIVLEISSWDRPYDTRIEAIRNELQGRR